jgi:hypothetical protein
VAVGFEPTVGFHPHTLSSSANPSSTMVVSVHLVLNQPSTTVTEPARTTTNETSSSGRPVLSAPGCHRRSALAGAGTVWFGGSGIRACLDCFVSGRESREVHLSKDVAQRRGRG